MPASDASIPWVVPLFRAIQSGKMPRELSPWIRNRASPGGGEPLGALDLADFGLEAGPLRDERVDGDAGEEVFVVRLVGRVDGDRRDPRLEHGRDLHLRRVEVLVVLDAVMVGVDGDGNRDPHLVAEGVDDARHVPVVDGAVGLLSTFRLGDLDDHRGVGPLGGPQRPPYHEEVAAVGGHGDGLPPGLHRAVDHLPADDQRPRVREKRLDVGGSSDLQGFLEIRGVRHGSSPSDGGDRDKGDFPPNRP